MRRLTYKYLTSASKQVGLWLFHAVAWWIATGYYILIPRRTKIGMDFYKALFPGESILYYMRCTWKQYHNFTNVFFDRFILHDFDDISYSSEGWKYIEDAAEKKTGGIILMSHIGNWEVAAHLLKRGGLKMLLYMGIKEKEQLERTQKESLEKSGLKIIAVMRDQSSPFDLIEGVNFLKHGGLVSLTGDRIWRGDQRSIKVNFLGHEVLLPETPYIFAMLSGAPLFFFFAFRTDYKKYHFSISKAIYIKNVSRSRRKAIFQKTAQEYANAMERSVLEYPYEWFHFERFLGKKLKEYK